jgi:hypothetical protein
MLIQTPPNARSTDDAYGTDADYRYRNKMKKMAPQDRLEMLAKRLAFSRKVVQKQQFSMLYISLNIIP